MNRDARRGWLVALTGVAFIVIGIIGFSIAGEPKSADDPVDEVVSFYLDNKDSVEIGAFMGVLAGLLLITFGAYLRNVLRGALGSGDIAPTIAFVGTTIVAVGFAIDGTISVALAEAADDIEPSAVQALQALWDNDFLPIMLGATAFLFGTGIAILRSGVLPKWLGGAMVLAGIIGFTPIGWVAAIAAALSVLVLSIMLALRARTEPVAA
jgi:hypothetical protein